MLELDYLIVCPYDLSSALTQRPHHQIDYLAKQNKSTTYLHLRSLYARGERRISRYNCKEETFGGVKIKAVNTPFPSPLFNPMRGLWIFLYMMFFVKGRYTVGVAQCPWVGIAFNLLRKIGKIRVYVYEDLDYHPGGHRNGLFKKIISIAERYSIATADLVVSVSFNLARLRMKQTARRVVLSSNGAESIVFRKALNKRPHPPTMIYVGAIEELFGLDLSVLAIREISKTIPDVRLLIAGTGSYEKDMRKRVAEAKLEKHIVFLGRVPHWKLPELMSGADVGLEFFSQNDLMHYACPIKIFEYMAAGLPVIAADSSETGRIVKLRNVGKVVKYSAEEFVMAVVQMLSNRSLYTTYSQNAIEASRNYEWDKIFQQEFREIDSLEVRQSSVRNRRRSLKTRIRVSVFPR